MFSMRTTLKAARCYLLRSISRAQRTPVSLTEAQQCSWLHGYVTACCTLDAADTLDAMKEYVPARPKGDERCPANKLYPQERFGREGQSLCKHEFPSSLVVRDSLALPFSRNRLARRRPPRAGGSVDGRSTIAFVRPAPRTADVTLIQYMSCSSSVRDRGHF